MKLYTYWRSTAAYRVRIALNLKGIAAEFDYVDLVKDGGQQHAADYQAINPGRTVPTLVLDDGTALVQSLAIVTYLDEAYADPALLPTAAAERARVNAAAQIIACDVHPINNLRVGQYLKEAFGRSQDDVVDWMHNWMRIGLNAYQGVIDNDSAFSFGDAPSLADICLVPQLYNARRWSMDLTGLERLVAIEQRCLAREAFAAAAPEAQPDAQSR